MNKNILIVFAFLLFNLGYGQKTWTGAVSTAWETNGNWSPAGKPSGTDDVLITNTTNQPVINAGSSCQKLTLSGDVVLTVRLGFLNAQSITMTGTNNSLKINGGREVTIAGNIAMGDVTNNVTFAGDGILNIEGAMTGGTLNADGIGTVSYDAAGAQTIGKYAYNNLTLSGNGVKTIDPLDVKVNGILSMEGTATASNAPTYGGDATLQYKSSSSQNAGPEWVTPFVATQGVIIANTSLVGVIVTGDANNKEKKFGDGVPLIIKAEGAKLTLTNIPLYLGGDFSNNGTLNTDKFVYLAGALDQNIDSFTSTEGVAMVKTDGTATFTGNISTKKLTINGAGTLDLGSGFTHKFTSDWTRTQGTLNANSSILEIGGNVIGTGGIFNAGSGTVDFNGGVQNLGAGSITYNNLTLSGTGIKTFGAVTKINETFSIANGTQADLTANLVHTAKNIKLGDNPGTGGSYGNGVSNAVNKNDTFFPNKNNGIVNVGPTINVDTTSLAAFNSVYGTPSVSKIVTVGATGMLGGILVTAPTGFEVSTNDKDFSDTVTIGAAGDVASTKVYVRLKGTVNSTIDSGNNYSGNLVLSSTGTTNVNIAIAPSTVTKAPLTITTEKKERDYGTDNPALTAIYSGFVNGDTVASLTTPAVIATAATKASSVGVYAITASGAVSSNYTFTYVTTELLKINPVALTISAVNNSKVYGAENPALAVTYVGFVNNDTAASLRTQPTIATTVTKTSSVGPYDITVSGADSPNYIITQNKGTLTVTQAQLIITAENISRESGVENPVLKVTYQGFVNGDTEASLTAPVKITTTAVKESLPGIYDIIIDNATSTNYKIEFVQGLLTVTISSNAGLTDLAINEGKLEPAFAEGTTDYTVKVPNDVKDIIVTPTTSNPNAVVTVNGVEVPSGTPSNKLPLVVGPNEIKTVVIAEDGTPKEYTIVVTREPSDDKNLTDLAISEGTLSPAFAEGTTDYTATVPNNVKEIAVTPFSSDPNATMTVNGKEVPSGTPSDKLPLVVGPNEIKTVVTAEDGTTKTYTVIVTREPSDNKNLTDLAISEGTLSPAFAEGITDYTATVPNNIENITVTPVTSDPNATMTVNGKEVPSGTPSDKLPLVVGPNEIKTVVKAEDGTTKTYTVIVTREPSANNNLTDLTISNGTLSPAFTEDTTRYIATVPNNIDKIAVTPFSSDAKAITVNGAEVPSGTPSDKLPLVVGENTITTVVTAEDGTTKEYTITVIREASSEAGLADIAVSEGELSPDFNTDTKDYRVEVPYETSTIIVTPAPIDPTSKIEMIVDGKTITDTTAPIDLKVGDNVVTIVVTAEDGTKETYTVVVNRADDLPKPIKPTNIITPNGDGKNDYWVIEGLDKYPNSSVKVFDRAARLMYSSNNYNNDWDGSYKGSPLNEDTYYYLIDLGNGSPKLKGFISIIRN